EELTRNHPLAEVLAGLRRQQPYERITLHGLTTDAVLALLESLAQQPMDDRGLEFAEGLRQETEGNPLFIEEIVRHLIETGVLSQDSNGRWDSSAPSFGDMEIPEGVREVIGRRLSRLSDDTNVMLANA